MAEAGGGQGRSAKPDGAQELCAPPQPARVGGDPAARQRFWLGRRGAGRGKRGREGLGPLANQVACARQTIDATSDVVLLKHGHECVTKRTMKSAPTASPTRRSSEAPARLSRVL